MWLFPTDGQLAICPRLIGTRTDVEASISKISRPWYTTTSGARKHPTRPSQKLHKQRFQLSPPLVEELRVWTFGRHLPPKKCFPSRRLNDDVRRPLIADIMKIFTPLLACLRVDHICKTCSPKKNLSTPRNRTHATRSLHWWENFPGGNLVRSCEDAFLKRSSTAKSVNSGQCFTRQELNTVKAHVCTSTTNMCMTNIILVSLPSNEHHLAF